jgi:hypothetical protein
MLLTFTNSFKYNFGLFQVKDEFLHALNLVDKSSQEISSFIFLEYGKFIIRKKTLFKIKCLFTNL